MTCRICGEDSPRDLLLRQKCGCWKLTEDEMRAGIVRLKQALEAKNIRPDPEPPRAA